MRRRADSYCDGHSCWHAEPYKYAKPASTNKDTYLSTSHAYAGATNANLDAYATHSDSHYAPNGDPSPRFGSDRLGG